MGTVTVNEMMLDGHAALDLQCLDRIYLNGYVPNMTQHLGLPIPSPAVMEKIGTRFRRDVNAFAKAHGIPMVKFGKGDRKAEVMKPHLARQARKGVSGVVA